MHVHLPSPWPDDLAARLARELPGWQVTTGSDPGRVDGVDILVDGRPDPALVDRMPALRGVFVPFAGLPATARDVLLQRPHLRAWNLHHNARAVAEHVVAMLLAMTRRIVPSHTSLLRGDWTPRYDGPRSRGLHGRHALVVGFGHIGRALAPMLAGLGMQVTGVRTRACAPVGGTRVIGIDALDRVLPTADAIVLALPSTDRTRGLFDAPRIAHIRDSAWLVNVGRADVLDEAALAAALHEHRLAGAALDVWWTYPPDVAARRATRPCSEALASAPNLLMSPHRSGHDDLAEDERVAGLARALRAIEAGTDARWRVDVARGY